MEDMRGPSLLAVVVEQTSGPVHDTWHVAVAAASTLANWDDWHGTADCRVWLMQCS